MFKLKHNQKGFAAIFITILVLVIILGIALSISLLTFGQQKISANIVRSNQAYYIAEAGIEDALLRLKQDPQMSNLSYNFNVAEGTTDVNIPDILGSSRIITSQGDNLNRIRKIQIVYAVSTAEIAFFYGVHIDEGGMEMGNNAVIDGNVFSNGNVISEDNKGFINNTVIVAKNNNKIKGLIVGENALAYSCEDSLIANNLTYVSGGSVTNCDAVETIVQPNEIQPEELPISQEQIDDWESEAASINIIEEDVIYNQVGGSLGAVQIGTPSAPKNLTIAINSELKIRGTIYVTGDIIFNKSIVELDEDYGSFSGVIIADGKITVNTNVVLKDSGEVGRFSLILSTNDSLDLDSPAIYVGNNADAAIFYTTSGLILLKNGMTVKEITGYKIRIENTARVEYESGLKNAIFTSGPGGSWRVRSWKGIE